MAAASNSPSRRSARRHPQLIARLEDGRRQEALHLQVMAQRGRGLAPVESDADRPPEGLDGRRTPPGGDQRPPVHAVIFGIAAPAAGEHRVELPHRGVEGSLLEVAHTPLPVALESPRVPRAPGDRDPGADRDPAQMGPVGGPHVGPGEGIGELEDDPEDDGEHRRNELHGHLVDPVEEEQGGGDDPDPGGRQPDR